MARTAAPKVDKKSSDLKVSKNSRTIAKADKISAKVPHKWNRKQVKDGDFFSCHQYMKVVRVSGNSVDLVNERGQQLTIEKDVLIQDSFSADHYEREVTCNMTELSEVLQGAKDTIFKVVFRKKIDEKVIQDKLASLSAKDIDSKAKEIAQELLEGQEVELIGHLVKSEQHMGRSLVIDLEAPADSNFRQVDHRTIQSIIWRNVKYTLGKKSTMSTLDSLTFKSTDAKWNSSKLKVGNWFSENQFYKLVDHTGSQWTCMPHNEANEEYSIDDQQMQDMYSATLFESQESLTRTQLVEILLGAQETAFTVTFRKKINVEDVQEMLATVKSDADLEKRRKELSHDLTQGKQTTIHGFLLKTEEKLGRSSIIDLSAPYGKGYRQVDHRTIEEIVIKNVKYTVK